MWSHDSHKEKPIVETHKGKEAKHTSVENYEITRKIARKEGTKKLQDSQKITEKMAVVIMTLHLNRLNSLIKRHKVIDLKKMNYMFPTRDSLRL